MRGFGLLASFILLAGLAACAEAAGPNYAYAPLERLRQQFDGIERRSKGRNHVKGHSQVAAPWHMVCLKPIGNAT
jgi:hypothetical protein